MTDEEFAARLMVLRKRKRLTQTLVAERLGWHKQLVWAMEHGERAFRVKDLDELALVYETSVEELLFGCPRRPDA